ncbi:NAD(P)H-dependent glycerol-3-phosphate dehydrogenase [Actibacterium pelagium]|uniref:Glycerol-3-phosphate dehydrogenase [NAD(P)+] n=1 Tax=Actibacterium pelagium TaxID=2029103 RepID=A0A917AIG7_9RHOB|nr:NAD(P)H-dependent glycerol-3-phosphate dehydrogenase [Actibacterium pelagium]GGE55746.1 glycerol-3-phosphate dehydrogenase [NAD(P)+] [Actibacterium pelagium]
MISVLGAGSFGTALAIALARSGTDVKLWSRDANHRETMRNTRHNDRYVAGIEFPASLTIVEQPEDTLDADAILLVVPMQALAGFLAQHPTLDGHRLVACCKGVDLSSGLGPTGVIAKACPCATPAILTGPSFAADIARGLPTALTLACADADAGRELQQLLSTDTLRLYRSTDAAGAEFGGALKNVIAIAAGIVIGAGLGDSARAALMTRGFAELTRFASARGAEPETLTGLSGLGDLILTCTSDLSRNFRHGVSLGQGQEPDARYTVEGVATAMAVHKLATEQGLDMPITAMIAAVVSGKMNVNDAVSALLARPLKEE